MRIKDSHNPGNEASRTKPIVAGIALVSALLAGASFFGNRDSSAAKSEARDGLKSNAPTLNPFVSAVAPILTELRVPQAENTRIPMTLDLETDSLGQAAQIVLAARAQIAETELHNNPDIALSRSALTSEEQEELERRMDLIISESGPLGAQIRDELRVARVDRYDYKEGMAHIPYSRGIDVAEDGDGQLRVMQVETRGPEIEYKALPNTPEARRFAQLEMLRRLAEGDDINNIPSVWLDFTLNLPTTAD